MRIAAAQWKIRPGTLESFLDHLSEFVERAATEKVELLVLPELPVLEILTSEVWTEEWEVPLLLSELSPQIESHLIQLAKIYKITIVGATYFANERDSVYNACPIVNPIGALTRTAKNRITKWEREEWKLTPGHTIAPPFGGAPSGALICYDSEFPEAARLLCESGAKLLCVPAYTESLQGLQRVRWSCLARAVENQVFVAHATIIGGFGREPLVDALGTAAVIAPSVEPFPVTAMLAETTSDQDELAVAELNFESLEQARANGDVRNWHERHVRPWRIETVT